MSRYTTILSLFFSILLIIITFVDVLFSVCLSNRADPLSIKGNTLFRFLYLAPMQSPGCAAPGQMDQSRKKGGAIWPNSLWNMCTSTAKRRSRLMLLLLSLLITLLLLQPHIYAFIINIVLAGSGTNTTCLGESIMCNGVGMVCPLGRTVCHADNLTCHGHQMICHGTDVVCHRGTELCTLNMGAAEDFPIFYRLALFLTVKHLLNFECVIMSNLLQVEYVIN